MKRQTLLRLYPHRWRERYGDEFLALLEQQPVTPAVALDVALGALDAHLRAHLSPVRETVGARAMQRLRALRTTALTLFCAYVTFVVAGLAFYGMVDDSAFIPAMDAHVSLTACWLIIEVGAAVSLAAVVAGGLPIGLATLAFALAHKRRDILGLLAVPVLALIIQALFFAAVIAAYRHLLPLPLPVTHSGAGQSPRSGNDLLVALNDILFIIGAMASTAAVATAVMRSEIGTQRFRALGVRIVIEPYRFALLPATVAALAMAVTAAGVISWGIVAHQVAPHAFTLGTLLIWLAIVGAMALATLIAAIGVARGHAANAIPILTDH
jgi:hypothetical protein